MEADGANRSYDWGRSGSVQGRVQLIEAVAFLLACASVTSGLHLQGQGDAFEAAHSKLKEALASKGYLQHDGSLQIENNQCHFITATK